MQTGFDFVRDFIKAAAEKTDGGTLTDLPVPALGAELRLLMTIPDEKIVGELF
jgi:hypothetical protein